MKIITTEKHNVESKENNIQLKPEDEELLASSNIPFSQIISDKLSQTQNGELLENFQAIGIDYSYDSVSMSLNDALFFINLTQEGQFSIETSKQGDFQNIIQTEIAQNTVSRKTVEVTNQLTTLIEKAQSTQKPVRISFDNDISVILKIDKHGKVSAEFIPGNIEVENYLKNNIASLKQRFDEQNLPYNDLMYRQNNKQNKNRKNRGE